MLLVRETDAWVCRRREVRTGKLPLPRKRGQQLQDRQLPQEDVNLSSNVYDHVVQDSWGNEDLLTNFRNMCARDGVSLDGISSKSIWTSLRQAGADYPKFTDLFWEPYIGENENGRIMDAISKLSYLRDNPNSGTPFLEMHGRAKGMARPSREMVEHNE